MAKPLASLLLDRTVVPFISIKVSFPMRAEPHLSDYSVSSWTLLSNPSVTTATSSPSGAHA